MTPTIKSFKCSRQGGEDWRCLADWGIQAKGLAGKNVIVGKSRWNQHFPKGMLVNMQDGDTILSPVSMLPVIATSPEAKCIADLKDCLWMMCTALLWSFVILWKKILARLKDSIFTGVNYKFPGISVLIDNQSSSQACRLLSCLRIINCDYHQNILTIFREIEKATNRDIHTFIESKFGFKISTSLRQLYFKILYLKPPYNLKLKQLLPP